MKAMRRITLILVLALLIGAFPAPALGEAASDARSGDFGNGLTWALADDGTLTVSGSGSMPVSLYNAQPWKDNMGLIRAVVIGEGVTAVSSYAFYRCETLETVTIGPDVEAVGSNAFWLCAALKRATLPAALKRVSEYAFWGCDALETVKYAGTKADWANIELSPGNVALSLAFGVDPLAQGACGDHLTWKLSRKGVLTIRGEGDMWDFARNSGSSGGITIRGKSPWAEYEKNVTAVTIGSGVTGIGDYAFSWFQSVRTLEIPDTVVRIGDFALYGVGVSALKLPPKLKTLSRYVLGCTDNLMHVELPSGLNTIGDGAFWGAGLHSIVLPASLTGIGASAFASCIGLTYVHYAGTKSKWAGIPVGDNNAPLKSAAMRYGATAGPAEHSGKCGKRVRWKLDAGGVLTISGTGPMADYPLSDESGYGSEWSGGRRADLVTAPWREYLAQIKKIVVKKGVTRIGDGAFFYCYNATSVSLPGTLTSIGKSAFRSMSITSITIPDKVETIDQHAFDRCFRLKRVKLPSRLKTVSDWCFDHCTSLKKLVLPKRVTTVGNAFGDTGIIDLTIPASVSRVSRDMGLGSGIGRVITLRFGGALPEGLPKNMLANRDIYCPAKYYADYRDYLAPWLMETAPGAYEDIHFGTISTSDAPAVLSAKALTLTDAKRSARLTASVGGATEGLSVKWSSSDSDAVKVTRKGKVTAKGYSGGALICAEVQYNGARTLLFCPVSVKYEDIDRRLFETLPTRDIRPNYLVTCSVSHHDEHGNTVSYQPSMYIETDTDNRYYKELVTLTRRLTEGCTTDEQKARKIFGWIGDNVTYSLRSVCIGETPAQAYAVYVNREGNCQGFSKLAGFMLSLVNVPCGTVVNDGHMWNIAWINGKWLMLDAQYGEGAFTADYSDELHSNIEFIIFAQGKSIFIIDAPGQVRQVGTGSSFSEAGRSDVTRIKVPEYVTSIKGGSFQYCRNLTKVTIPATVKTIADDAFKGCDRLTIYCYRNSAAHAFAKEHGIPFKLLEGTGQVMAPPMALVLPTAMTSIESKAFANLRSVETIVIPATVKAIADDAFEGTDAVFVVAAGSCAEAWVREHGFTYVAQ